MSDKSGALPSVSGVVGSIIDSVKSRSAVAAHELSTAVRIHRSAASRRAIRARAATARGSFVSPNASATRNRMRESGSLARSATRSIKSRDRLSRRAANATAWARTSGVGSDRTITRSSSRNASRPSSDQRALTRVGGNGASAGRSSLRRGSIAAGSRRSWIKRWAVSRYQPSRRQRDDKLGRRRAAELRRPCVMKPGRGDPVDPPLVPPAFQVEVLHYVERDVDRFNDGPAHVEGVERAVWGVDEIDRPEPVVR